MKIVLLTFLLFISSTFCIAQDRSYPCVTNHNAPPVNAEVSPPKNDYHWPRNTIVKVYFVRAMFSYEQMDALFEAMKTWSDVAAETGAGISFVYAGEIDDAVSCIGCLTVTRREVYKNDRKHYAFFYPVQRSVDGLLLSARIDLDFATTKPEALRGFMTHELGHGMGLWDCTTCKSKLTIMNGFPGINKDNGLLEPSICDREAVRQVYELDRRVSSNTTVDLSQRQKSNEQE